MSSQEHTNPLKVLLDQADELDFSDPETGESSANAILTPGFEISKLLQILDFALSNAGAETPHPMLEGLDITPREEMLKKTNGVFQFEVTNKEGKKESFYADMKKAGRIFKGKSPKKADVVLQVKDKDMVALALGQSSPQRMFLAGKLKVKGNLMLGLRMNDVLASEVAKLSKL
ncbi:uncharacterized protein L969DRAFT_95768 [Mixia osmundae IAM 14324]|uniref:SCP2 domain-containing protein n=1 Tax=Mixia osmundae (strain CBS 9802 / IAM 14324 / JCM 22182 / KY 12970) TaxID=764103 RepID=G7DSM6_MIXOS|nr:uncharacterized protein L969DRAFT_95768 [Mixia osmundae IAM 14324]KEI37918.1 hypothetical protein L969DRAFT_95768 [Mixia osmundae IAM 14324]GAA93586.1 hypothetical protein E5Q_00230 [Mixia osmundae IAM 14324]